MGRLLSRDYLLTSSIARHQISEFPDVPNPNTVSNSSYQEVVPSGPVASLLVFIFTPGNTSGVDLIISRCVLDFKIFSSLKNIMMEYEPNLYTSDVHSI